VCTNHLINKYIDKTTELLTADSQFCRRMSTGLHLSMTENGQFDKFWRKIPPRQEEVQQLVGCRSIKIWIKTTKKTIHKLSSHITSVQVIIQLTTKYW